MHFDAGADEGLFLKKILRGFVMFLRAILRDLFQKEYHSCVNFNADPVLEIKKFLVSMSLRGWVFSTYAILHTYARQMR